MKIITKDPVKKGLQCDVFLFIAKIKHLCVVDPRGNSRVDPQNVMTKCIVNNRTDV